LSRLIKKSMLSVGYRECNKSRLSLSLTEDDQVVSMMIDNRAIRSNDCSSVTRTHYMAWCLPWLWRIAF